MPQPSAPELISVQYLRGAARLMVVFHHALINSPASALMPTQRWRGGRRPLLRHQRFRA